MKIEPSDQDEEARARSLAEQTKLWPTLAAILAIIGYGCAAHGAECRLTWDSPPASQQVTSWKIYRGIDLVATTTSNSVTLDITTSAVTTLAVRAVNAVGESDPAIIHLVPFVPSFPSPGTLTGWQRFENKTIFREKRHCDFAHYGCPTFPIP